MIRRWAPPEDGNDTESYISTVSNLSGVPRTSRLTTTNRSVMEPIVRAMIKVETGTRRFSRRDGRGLEVVYPILQIG
ncbi:MAG: hypothetical protein ACLR8Y_13245 [Alistipes indistinctus]